MQSHRLAGPERRSRLLKKVTTLRIAAPSDAITLDRAKDLVAKGVADKMIDTTAWAWLK